MKDSPSKWLRAQLWRPAFRRFCQIPADAFHLLKNAASALSAKISFLMGSGKPALALLLFSSLAVSPGQPTLLLWREASLLAPRFFILASCLHACIPGPSCPCLAASPVCEEHFACINLQAYLTPREESTHPVSTHRTNRWLAHLHPVGAC